MSRIKEFIFLFYFIIHIKCCSLFLFSRINNNKHPGFSRACSKIRPLYFDCTYVHQTNMDEKNPVLSHSLVCSSDTNQESERLDGSVT